MEGFGRGRQPPLEVQREYAVSRLEEQILIRVFELVVPVTRRSLRVDRRSMAKPVEEHEAFCLGKGA
jgi:hypothetical protein